jgi:hypothetical protein
MLASFAFVSVAAAAPPTVGTLLSGLINVNVGDITITDVVVVDVQDVLNDNQVEILNNVLNNSPIASNNSNILNDLLRRANIITGNQIVVGVLGGTFFILDTTP